MWSWTLRRRGKWVIAWWVIAWWAVADWDWRGPVVSLICQNCVFCMVQLFAVPCVCTAKRIIDHMCLMFQVLCGCAMLCNTHAMVCTVSHAANVEIAAALLWFICVVCIHAHCERFGCILRPTCIVCNSFALHMFLTGWRLHLCIQPDVSCADVVPTFFSFNVFSCFVPHWHLCPVMFALPSFVYQSHGREARIAIVSRPHCNILCHISGMPSVCLQAKLRLDSG